MFKINHAETLSGEAQPIVNEYVVFKLNLKCCHFGVYKPYELDNFESVHEKSSSLELEIKLRNSKVGSRSWTVVTSPMAPDGVACCPLWRPAITRGPLDNEHSSVSSVQCPSHFSLLAMLEKSPFPMFLSHQSIFFYSQSKVTKCVYRRGTFLAAFS